MHLRPWLALRYIHSIICSLQSSENPFLYIFYSINMNNTTAYLDILALKARGQRLGELLGLLGILYLERVQVAAASDLELCLRGVLLDPIRSKNRS